MKNIAQSQKRNKRKNLTGVVVSRSGNKTVKVAFYYKIPHSKYKKEIKRKTVVIVHDENNQCQVNDRVEIMETRPLSRLKRFRLVEILEKSPSET